ncbi:MAG TPA: LuxR C-terminal-related transcriptional regulator [Streptosporangiaceae bacterium]|nr:LuxR C-terminal-related transcriptional regulator [Streptosporangiaceae bacterium]
MEVLELVAAGASNSEAAAGLFISEATVKTTCCTSTPSSVQAIALPRSPRHSTWVADLSLSNAIGR